MSNRVLRGKRLQDYLAERGLGEASLQVDDSPFVATATQSFLDNIDPRDAKDPLLLQILPQAAEAVHDPRFTVNPVQDVEHEAAPGLIHKYRNRVLLLASRVCPIHCRYCFRKDFPYQQTALSQQVIAGWIEYVRARPEIHEAIFSGGDPLFADQHALVEVCRQFSQLGSIRALRFHSRVPIVYPELIDEPFIEAVGALNLRVVFVLHINHARELNSAALALIRRLRQAGFLLLSQSVLLKDVNDSAVVLAQLFEALVDQGILPYYLNLLDKVSGAAHFEVGDARALEIYRELLRSCSGYTVPKLVRDEGGLHKQMYC